MEGGLNQINLVERLSRKVEPKKEYVFGSHYLVELIDCDAELLRFVDPLEQILLEATRRCGATYVAHHSKQFEPVGATVVILIAESHITLHTWPERSYAAMDVFTCGEMDCDAAIEHVSEQLRARKQHIRMFERGY